MSTELEPQRERPVAIQPQVGLRLSIADPKPDGPGPGRQHDWFRAKDGDLEQYVEAARRFHEVYGEQPKSIDDVYFLSNVVGDVLDIRVKWWGQSGLKGVGFTNFATLPEDEFEKRVEAWDDDILAFLDNQQEPVQDKLKGPDDPRIAKYGMNVEATLRFCLPQVTGLGTVVEITSKGRRTRRNLYSAAWDFDAFLRGNLVGIPFRLSARWSKSRYWDPGKGKWKSTKVVELVLDTPLTVAETFERLRDRQTALTEATRLALPAGASPEELSPELFADRAREIAENLRDLPEGEEQDVKLRDEPEGARPTDAQLNRIADLERQLGDEHEPFLVGAFGVESAEKLTPAQAEQYEIGLQRLTESGEHVEGEVVDPEESEPQIDFPIPEKTKKQS